MIKGFFNLALKDLQELQKHLMQNLQIRYVLEENVQN